MGKVKGCINQDCLARQKKTKYKGAETACPECGQKLSFVCPKCFTVLSANDGKYCIRCAEGKKDIRDKALKAAGTAVGCIVAVVGTVASLVGAFSKKE